MGRTTAKLLTLLAGCAALPALVGAAPANAGVTDAVTPRFALEGSVKYVAAQLDPLPVALKNMASATNDITYASPAVAPFIKPNETVKWYGSPLSEYRQYSMVDGQHQWRAVEPSTALGNGVRLQVLGAILPVPGDGFTGRPYGTVIRLGAFPPVDKHLDLAVAGVATSGNTYEGRVVGPDFEGEAFTFTGNCTQAPKSPEVGHSGTFTIGDPAGDSITGTVATVGNGNRNHRGTITGGTGAYAGVTGASSFVWRLATCQLPTVLAGTIDVDLF